jgi:hypothetical protein
MPFKLGQFRLTHSRRWMFCRILGFDGLESYRERGWGCYAVLTV